MIKWKDETSYSCDDIGRSRKPRTWATRIGLVRLVVTRHIHAAEDEWTVLVTPDLFGGRISLGTVPLEDAKAKALELLDERVTELHDKVKSAMS